MITRRWMLALGAAAAAGVLTAARASDAPIRVGLAGAGSEGIVLAKDAMRADPRVRLVAIADDSGAAARRALSVFAHPLRKGGVHPQLEMDGTEVFAGRNASAAMIEAIPLDAVLVVGSGAWLATGLSAALAAGVDAYAKPDARVDGATRAVLLDLASVAAARGIVLGADMPWRCEACAIASDARTTYPRTQSARALSFSRFLSACALRASGTGDLAEMLAAFGERAA